MNNGASSAAELMPSSPFQNAGVRIAVVVLLALLTVIAFRFSGTVNNATESGVVMSLPSVVGGFVGRDEAPSEGEKHVLPSDTEIVKKAYRNINGDILYAQIVLAGAEKRSIHRPELCLPAQGWSLNQQEKMPVKIADGKTLTMMNDDISRPVETAPGQTRPLESIYSYCFVGNGVTTPSHFMRLFLTSWDRIAHRKNHRWAYLVVTAPVLQGFKSDGKNAEETKKMISDFIAKMAPEVLKR